MNKRFLSSELPLLSANECRFHIIPVPFEATVSYGSGTALGPDAILEASNYLETWTGRAEPSAQGIFTHATVACDGTADEVLGRIETAVAKSLAEGPQGPPPQPKVLPLPTMNMPACYGTATLPILLGGEHTVTLGALRALKKKYGHFGVIQFDAHADLRDSYEGSPYSHACVMRRAVADLGLDLFQIGVRSLCKEEAAFRKQAKVLTLDASVLRCPRPWPNTSRKKNSGRPIPPLLPAHFPDLVFITFDVDAFDASLMPATGTPEPGGLFWWDALHLLERSMAGRVTIGFDVVELAPIAGLHAPPYTAARLVHEIMGIIKPVTE